MTGVERKIAEFVRKYAVWILFVLATGAGVLLRAVGMDFKSDDFNSFLLGWWNIITDQDFSGLSRQVGNYNIPYQVIIFFLTRVMGEALHAYKLVSVLFDFALAAGAGLLAAQYRGERFFRFVPVMTYAVVLCSLTVVLNSAFWGQCDSMYVSLILFALYCTMKERHIAAFILLGVSLAFKLQMIFILPLYLYYYVSVKKVSILHFFLIPLTDIVMCLPAVFCGRPIADIINIYVGQTDYGKQIQMNYPNLYAFMCDGRKVEYYYLLKPMTIVLTMGILAAGLLLVLYRRVDLSKPEKLMMTGIWTSFTCLMFLSSMHERYSYLLDALLMVYFFMTKKHPFVAVTASLISLRGYCYYLFGNYEALTLAQTAVVNTALYVYVTFLIVRETVMDLPVLCMPRTKK